MNWGMSSRDTYQIKISLSKISNRNYEIKTSPNGISPNCDYALFHYIKLTHDLDANFEKRSIIFYIHIFSWVDELSKIPARTNLKCRTLPRGLSSSVGEKQRASEGGRGNVTLASSKGAAVAVATGELSGAKTPLKSCLRTRSLVSLYRQHEDREQSESTLCSISTLLEPVYIIQLFYCILIVCRF